MNMFKSNGGFTLVELIVVIAILAILAGIAVPAYSGYIKKANEAADYTMLDSVKTAVIFEVMEQNPEAVVGGITVGTSTSTGITVTDPDGDAITLTSAINIAEYMNNATTLTYKSGAVGATWSAAAAKWTLTPATPAASTPAGGADSGANAG